MNLLLSEITQKVGMPGVRWGYTHFSLVLSLTTEKI